MSFRGWVSFPSKGFMIPKCGKLFLPTPRNLTARQILAANGFFG